MAPHSTWREGIDDDDDDDDDTLSVFFFKKVDNKKLVNKLRKSDV